MGTIKDLHDLIAKLADERGSATVLRERLSLARDLANSVLQENEKLEKRVTDAENLCRELTRQLQAKARDEEFVEHRGVLFKRKVGGGYHDVPYCPICRAPLSSIMDELPFACRQACGFVAGFTGRDLRNVVSDLN